MIGACYFLCLKVWLPSLSQAIRKEFSPDMLLVMSGLSQMVRLSLLVGVVDLLLNKKAVAVTSE